MMCGAGIQSFRAYKMELAVCGVAIVLNMALALGEQGSSSGLAVLAKSRS